jgi:hypothetical protein
MNREQALAYVIACAARWAERSEETLGVRLSAGDTDADLERYGIDLDDGRLVRDAWRAIEILQS